jgi:hypothetical protein
MAEILGKKDKGSPESGVVAHKSFFGIFGVSC